MAHIKKKTNKKTINIDNHLLQAILKHAPILISAKDPEGNVLFTSEQFSLLDGPEPEDYVGRNVFDLFPKDIAEKLWENDLRAQRSETPVTAEEEVFHSDGTRHIYQTYKFRLLDENESLLGTCAVSIDITHHKQMEHEARHDSLTELLNRRYLDTCFSNELRRARRAKEALLFVLFDLDGFKQFNDQYGHVIGDDLLADFSKQLKKHFQRPSDFCFRLGGDEFAVIFLADDIEKAIQQVNRVGIDMHSRWEEKYEHTCSVSAGVRVIDGQEEFTSKNAYRQADEALYLAKERGKNRVVIYREDAE